MKIKWYHFLKAWFLLVFLYLVYELFKSPDDVISNVTSIANPVIALAGLGFIGWQLHSNAVQARRLKTYEISGKMQNSDFLFHLTQARGFFVLTDKLSNEEKWQKYVNNEIDKDFPKISSHIFIALAYFEDMAMLYNRNHIDKELVKTLLRSAIIGYYEESEWFRLKKRENNDNAYTEFDRMYQDLKTNQ